jgi:hypothetical protein
MEAVKASGEIDVTGGEMRERLVPERLWISEILWWANTKL